MKKAQLFLLLALAALLLSGCGGSRPSEGSNQETAVIGTVPEVLSQAEYVLYQNVFYNDYGPKLAGKEAVKQGVLGKIHDAFNGRDRCYVWGYMDSTHCCDWRWEIVPGDEAGLPAAGSLVRARGDLPGG